MSFFQSVYSKLLIFLSIHAKIYLVSRKIASQEVYICVQRA